MAISLQQLRDGNPAAIAALSKSVEDAIKKKIREGGWTPRPGSYYEEQSKIYHAAKKEIDEEDRHIRQRAEEAAKQQVTAQQIADVQRVQAAQIQQLLAQLQKLQQDYIHLLEQQQQDQAIITNLRGEIARIKRLLIELGLNV